MTNDTMVGTNSTAHSVSCKVATTARDTQYKAVFDPSIFSDNELFSLCQQYGNNAKMWKRKFEELLPEVMKRELYKKRRFITIYEFAAKVSGLSYDSVDEVLRVYKQLEDKPILRSLVVEFGWSKLRIVSGIATPETDASWAEKVRVLPKSSLETFVRDLKRQEEKARIEAGIAGKCEEKVGGWSGVGTAAGGMGRGCGAAVGGAGGTMIGGGASDSVGGTTRGNAIGNSEIKTIESGVSTGQGWSTDGQRLSDNKSPNCELLPGEKLPSGQYSGQIDMRTGEIRGGEIDGQTGRPIFGSAENDWPIMSFKVDPETEFRLRKLKIQIEKERKFRISFNQFFKIMIERAEVVRGSGKRQIDAQKERLAEKKISTNCDEKSEKITTKAIKTGSVTGPVGVSAGGFATGSASRYIPIQIRRELERKYHWHCGFPGCKKPSCVYHHVRRFALNKAHNLASIVPLCKEHHDVVHGGWVGNEQDPLVRPFDWKLEHEEKWFLPSHEIDEIWKGCRKVGGR